MSTDTKGRSVNNASIPKRFGLVVFIAAALTVLATSIALAATVTDTAGDDTLRGTERADDISGRGNDHIRARGGSDVAQGGPGNDDVYGMDGPDRDVAGGVGDDNLYGGLGGDTLRAAGVGDSDNVYCDQGTDTAIVEVGDLVDDRQIVSETVLPTGTSCEVIVVQGLPLP